MSFSFIYVERDVEEPVWITHIHLEPVNWGVKLDLDALADDRHFWLGDFDLLCFDVLVEQDWELVKEDLSDCYGKLVLLPCFKLRIQLIHSTSVLSNRLFGDFPLNLHVSMVQVAEHTDRVAFEVSDWPQQVRLVDFPECLVVVFEETVLYHLVRIYLCQVRQDFCRVAHTQELGLFERVDEGVLVGFERGLEHERLLVGLSFVVES